MSLIRSKSKLLFFVLFAGILFLGLEMNIDCIDSASPPITAHHCCVQCCPAHHLGPVSQFLIKLSTSTNHLICFYADQAFRYQDPILDSLYRPPIV